jgi:hypothetical protein
MRHIQQPRLHEYIRRFLYDILNPNSVIPGADISIEQCPVFFGRVRVYHSATSIYYAPSDISGTGGMHRERIRATPSWYKGAARYDTVFITKDQEQDGFRGLHVGRVFLFFDFHFAGALYPCALVEWFVPCDLHRCELTRMWLVKPDVVRGCRVTSVIHVDTILRGAHLIGAYGNHPLPRGFSFQHTLYAFQSYYVNKFIDHHSHEIAF